MVEDEEGSLPVLTSGCLGLVGSEFQCRVSLQCVWCVCERHQVEAVTVEVQLNQLYKLL